MQALQIRTVQNIRKTLNSGFGNRPEAGKKVVIALLRDLSAFNKFDYAHIFVGAQDFNTQHIKALT